MKKNVLIIQRRMTEYRVPMFEALRARLAQDGVTLQVAYGTPTALEALRNDAGVLPWGMEVPCRYLGSGKFQLVWQSIPRRFLKEQDLIIIPHENMLLLNHLLLFQRRRPDRQKLAFWGHGANFQSREKKSIRERFKTWTARQVDWWFAYTALSAQKVMAGGFPAERITCLNNAVDVGSLQKWRGSITDEERVAILRELGLQGTRVAVFIGGLYREKRLDFLFAAADELRRRLPDFELLIIGNGPQGGLVREFTVSRPWCRWVGARHNREKALYVSIGQVMLNPGLVGLNILDSFALGVPLLTTDCGIHSPEIAYLESGRNGIMTVNDLHEYVHTTARLLTEAGVRQTLAHHCAQDAERYSLGNMVSNFRTGILQALDGQNES